MDVAVFRQSCGTRKKTWLRHEHHKHKHMKFLTRSSIYQFNEAEGVLEFVTNIRYVDESQLAQRLGRKSEGKVFREFDSQGLRSFTVANGSIHAVNGRNVPASHMGPASAWF